MYKKKLSLEATELDERLSYLWIEDKLNLHRLSFPVGIIISAYEELAFPQVYFSTSNAYQRDIRREIST